ncbi:alpha/beta hydrolase family protein [Azomonas macrocytogenes]|uniref:AB hydrolase-1 domain-containing protein n=1 Tax=Azomonas macrocytogenes TaxID=69962 RepID=A0A839T3I2_AZOMA|nr:alpha/beta fold hydrolase [Azomonas macrocytogenes]MBB3103658.1 hypothetical protein [Azomonas macrocytogenes]
MRSFILLLVSLLMTFTVRATTLQQQIVKLDTDSGALYGTLLIPKVSEPPPVALLIAGSGPTNRDGNNSWARNDSLKLLAQALAQRGIASLRYDKRGVEASYDAGPDESRFTVEHFTQDAIEWGHQLKSSGRFSRLILIGHSEGALLASLAAESAGAEALVSIAGSGRPIDTLLLTQLQSKQLPPLVLAYSKWLIAELGAGRIHTDVPQPLMELFRPSVQPYLISLFRQDPALAFGQLKIPALIVQGRNDIQVSVEDAEALHRAKPDAELVLLEGMNHVLRIVPNNNIEQQLASYANPNLPLARGLPAAIADFIQRN